jgi:hypothetical protein
VAGDLPGAQSARQAAALRHVAVAVLGDLGGALDRLGRLLSASSGRYADAERQATQMVTPGSSSAAAPGAGRGSVSAEAPGRSR